MALTADMQIILDWEYTNPADLSTPDDTKRLIRGKRFANGTGANQANFMFSDQRTLTDGANETLQISDSSLTNVLGVSVDFAKLKMMYVRNNGTEASLLIGGAASTQLGIFSDGTDILVLPPGGEFYWSAPAAAGLDVTTNEDIKFAHDGTGTASLTYDLILVGTST